LISKILPRTERCSGLGPNGKADLAHKPPAELLDDITKKENEIGKIINEIKKLV